MKTSSPTVPPAAHTSDTSHDVLAEEQQRLTKDLLLHMDPMVRVIAHISNRQLDMSLRLADAVHEVGKLAKAVDALTTAVSKLTGSVAEVLEQYRGVESRMDALEHEMHDDPTVAVG